MAKSEGAQVREAIDGPQVEHDELITGILARAAEQHARKSDASESAAKVSAFLEQTGVNSQAYSWVSTIIKKLPKKDGQHKAMDIIRSLEVLLPMIKNHVAGQGTGEMDLGEPEQEPETDAEEELKEDAADFGQAAERADDDTVTPIDFGKPAAE